MVDELRTALVAGAERLLIALQAGLHRVAQQVRCYRIEAGSNELLAKRLAAMNGVPLEVDLQATACELHLQELRVCHHLLAFFFVEGRSGLVEVAPGCRCAVHAWTGGVGSHHLGTSRVDIHWCGASRQQVERALQIVDDFALA